MVMTNAPIGTAICTGKPKLPKAITTEAPKPASVDVEGTWQAVDF